jgi:dolichyl-phosphate-mannose-protein mannosyltransferase
MSALGSERVAPANADVQRRLGATPWISAATVVVVLLALADRYGFHRDELYFLIDGRHPAFGYDDQPPVTPLLARAQQAVFGDSPLAVRVWPALVAGTVVVLAAVMCRDLGGARRAQAMTAVAVAASPGVLLAGHLLSTEVTDLLVWQVVLLLAVRALRDDRPKLWLAVGLVVGIGLQNKDLVGFLAVALIVGLVISRRDMAASRFLWLGGLLALVIAAPAIAWQAAHGFPEWQVAQSQRHGTGPVKYLVQQLLVLNPALLPAIIRGTTAMWRDRRYRPLVWAFAALEVFFLVTGGKSYYPAPILVLLAAAGVAATPALRDDRVLAPPRLAARYAVIAVLGLLLVPAVLPVLPEATFASSPYAAEDDTRATIGWPQLAAQVDSVTTRIGGAHPVVLTESYGEAGPIERFGRRNLTVVSGHNSLWYYRRPPDGTVTVITVGYAPDQLAAWFTHCRSVATLHTPHGVDNQEDGAPMTLCAGPRQPWAQLWPRLHHDN